MRMPHFNALAGVIPCEYPINYLSRKYKIVLPDAEYRTIISSFLWTKHRNVRMDGRTKSL